MLTQIDILVHLQHQKDLLREAEQERLARLAVSTQPTSKAGMKTKFHKNTQFVEALYYEPASIACCIA